MTTSFSAVPGFFVVSWRNNGSTRSVTMLSFVKAMELYFSIKTNRPRIWYFPRNGRLPVMIRSET